ncbi:MAG: amino acid adenylation domain-containing protein, partial [Streptosporangiaceae bacterium]|nr:amino acid adenylation domain-containing protein [Streptosporangiaceae bacterium]
RVVEVDAGGEVLAGCAADVPPVPVAGDSAAYVIYTSGSTGRPKGVTVTHAAVTRLLRWGEGFFGFGPDDVWSMFHSTSFDFSVWEMWGALSTGGRLVIVPYWVSRGPEDFYRLVAEAQVSVLCQTPTSFAQLEAVDAQENPPLALRWVIFGGEALDRGSVRRWAQRHGWDHPRLVNMYGITETTVHVTARVLGAVDVRGDLRGDLSQIGREVGGLTAHVLDGMLSPVAVGAVGELYVGGARLARGYTGRPALTAERFVADPHGTQPGGRLYRTGDRVRLRPDGTFEYAGRSDNMVNLKGFRVEPGEIEATLARHPAVAAAAVALRRDGSGRASLIGYVAPAGPDGLDGLDVAEVRQWLRERLPEYMLPAQLMLLGSLPLTPSGKVDRSALPEPGYDGSLTGPAPRTPPERILCELFAELLGIPGLGIDGSFFELGGDSIMSIQLVSRARRAGLRISPKDVYEKRTVRALAAVATEVERPAGDPPQCGTGPVPLTPILAWARELGGPMDAFSQSVLIRVPAAHTAEQVRAALQVLLDHHDALRMVARIGPGDEPWELEIPPAGSVRAGDCLRSVDLSGVPEADRPARIAAEADQARSRLRPGAGQLVQAVWFDAGQGAVRSAGHLLLVVIHHVAVDGVSWRILLADLTMACTAIAAGQPPVLDPVPTSLRHWARRLSEIAAEASYEEHVPAWAEILKRVESPLGFRPLDPNVDTFGRLHAVSRTVPPGCTTAVLTTAPAAYRVGVDDILLTALALAMPPWLARRGHDDRTAIVLDLERHGRDGLVPDADLSRTVGWFTSIHPVRLDPGPVAWPQVQAGGRAVSAAVKQVKEQLRGLPPGGEYGVLRYLSPQARDALAGMPAPHVAFNYLGRFPAGGSGGWALAEGDLALQGGADPRQPVPHTLSISAMTVDSADGPQLRTVWAWPEGLLDDAEVADLADAWMTALEAIVASSMTPFATGRTPSDLTLVSLSQDEIDDLEEELSAQGGAES